MDRLRPIYVCLLAATIPIWWASWFHSDDSLFSVGGVVHVASLLVALALIGLISVFLASAPVCRFRVPATGLLVLGLALLQSFNWAHLWVFRHQISVGAIDAIFSTSTGEAYEFLTIFDWQFFVLMAIYWLLIVGVFGFSIRKIRYANAPCRRINVIVVMSGALFLSAATVLMSLNDPPKNPGVWSLLKATSRLDPNLHVLNTIRGYLLQRTEFIEAIRARDTLSVSAQRATNRALTVVLVLGESARMRNHSVYGYPRVTTPFLDSVREELLILEAAISPSVNTQDSTVYMLTTMANSDRSLVGPAISIVDVANAAKFQTFWISNQGTLGVFDAKTTVLANGSKSAKFFNTGFMNISYDEKLIPAIQDALNEESSAKFIVVHLMGSHAVYSRRYPDTFAGFSVADYEGLRSLGLARSQRAKLAEYDTSILYTDSFLNQLIQLLRGRSETTRLVYLSDHGEVLDNWKSGQKFGHGTSEIQPDHYRVPVVFWSSVQKEIGNNSELVLRRENRSLPYSTENIFHSLISMLDVRCECYEAERDILSSAFEPIPLYVRLPTQELIEINMATLEAM